MSLYEARLQADIDDIRKRVEEVGASVEEAIRRATRALLQRDRALAYQTMLDDLPINRATREIDRRCHALVARHSPAAGHLRFVSSVLRLSIALERIGDYAVTICRQSVQLSTAPPPSFTRDVELIASQSTDMLRSALQAFNERDGKLAKKTMRLAKKVHVTYDTVFNDLLAESEKAPLQDVFALLGTFNQLERVSDQAKNICEETVFVVTGETKKPKVYKVLFIDKTNACHSQLAEAIAKRAFPNSGDFSSAGWEPRDEIFEPLVAHAEQKGLDVSAAKPTALADRKADLASFHVIVSVRGDPMPHLESIPFHTALLEWNVDDIDTSADEAEVAEAMENVHQQLSMHVRTLMVTMRGEEAD